MHSDARPRPGAGPAGRSGLVEQLLVQALSSLLPAEAADAATTTGAMTTGAMTSRPALQVLDCGGGSGRYAVPLALAGAAVTVVDISVDALATLSRRAEEAGVAERIVSVQGDVEALAELTPTLTTDGFDLVLAHGILEAIRPLGPVFGAICESVRPGGLVSTLVDNPVAAVLARALAGDLSAARRELSAADDPDRPSPALVEALCRSQGLVIEQVHGIGVFADLVPGAALDQPGARDALAALETACARRAPFADIASRVHVLARRPIG